ncbi:Methyltransferase domain-containing protein [Quadrisphaera granulorum]|uniref:Methyltransferase family protein n=1 Tax=Quadrisphaera granulorum TaxID=317664 RepID=A0A315ZT07_9ACTN|nr:class I SAM-dependent methyltransferase [Quadrisphaera granulorum]PWJ47864.1 methyltransferase family protein [Quadrisphaera granulorum]SZE98631.1 Methyltransferase domain-containing protein [Quadrisphaera granulorum]
MAPDAHYEHPRLVPIYDALDPDRSDLEPYLALAAELGSRRVLDLGCGTGVLALLFADRGLEVTGLDPAAGSLAVASGKPGAERVRWVHGDARALADLTPPVVVDLVTMTGNAAQAVTDDDAWAALLRAAHDALTPNGHLVFETRLPEARGWEVWTPEATRTTRDLPDVGRVSTWTEVTDVSGPASSPTVRFTQHFAFDTDGAVLTSHSVLRFRSREQVTADLAAAALEIIEVRDAPDRPGLEMVFLARRHRGPGSGHA